MNGFMVLVALAFVALPWVGFIIALRSLKRIRDLEARIGALDSAEGRLARQLTDLQRELRVLRERLQAGAETPAAAPITGEKISPAQGPVTVAPAPPAAAPATIPVPELPPRLPQAPPVLPRPGQSAPIPRPAPVVRSPTVVSS